MYLLVRIFLSSLFISVRYCETVWRAPALTLRTKRTLRHSRGLLLAFCSHTSNHFFLLSSSQERKRQSKQLICLLHGPGGRQWKNNHHRSPNGVCSRVLRLHGGLYILVENDCCHGHDRRSSYHLVGTNDSHSSVFESKMRHRERAD